MAGLLLLGLVLTGLALTGCPSSSSDSDGDGNTGRGDRPILVKRNINYEGTQIKKESFDAIKTKDGKFIKNGSYLKFHENGKPAEEGSFFEDKMNGKWTFWNEEGVKLREVDYTDGVIDGKHLEFFPDGNPKQKTTYKNGQVDGNCVIYYPNGLEKAAGYMIGDKRDGEWLFWTERGKRWKKEQYEGGKLVIREGNLETIRQNEAKVVSKLKELRAGIDNFKNSVCVDQDEDGEGEFGFFPELAGTSACRTDGGLGGPSHKARPFVDSFFGKVNKRGEVVYAGYVFCLYLPGPKAAIGSNPTVPNGDAAVADDQEASFALYAWPVNFGVTGKQAFFLNQDRILYTTKNDRRKYQGETAPAPAAIYDRASKTSRNLMAELGTTETDKKPTDGETWYPVQ
jgi:antitoxin component YwqK of YwqJK toxin-antitoxin module